MAISLVGKLVITVVCLAVAGGMTATIVLVVNDSTNETQQEQPVTGGTTEYPVEPIDSTELLYEVGVGIADMTGPCVEIAFVSTKTSWFD